MDASGFPFPPTFASSQQTADDGLLLASTQRRLLCSPSVISPDAYPASSSVAPTPGDFVRDPTLLPSIMSPPIAPSASGPGVQRSASVWTPSDSCLSFSASNATRMTPSAQEATLPSVFSEAAPASPPMPTPPQDKPRQLWLPSFQGLGIANPHPDDLSPSTSKIMLKSAGVASTPGNDSFNSSLFRAASGHSLDGSCDVGSGDQHSHLPVAPRLPRDLAILTPPDERPAFDWSTSEMSISDEKDGRGPDVPVVGTTPQPTQGSFSAGGLSTPEDSQSDDAEWWLEGAIENIIASIDPTNLTGYSLRALSHALPSPSTPGHSFPHVLESLRNRLPESPMMFINLLHAVPGRFNLSDLPTSPPSTPGQPLGSSNGTGEDYFTSKVFESAVTAVDYSSSDGLTAMPAASAFFRNVGQHFPLAAPSSLNFSIVERFIPPSSRNEFMNLFSVSKPSLLVDRLVELLPGNGCLVFIYPTRAGAETFCNKYLGPILDPLLRAMVVVNNFSSDLSGAIGRMAAVQHMHDFDTMRRKVTELCGELQRGSTNPQVRQRLHGSSGAFSLVYAARKHVCLDRDVWADWYIKQEKTRVRNAVGLHFRLGNRYLADTDTAPTQLIQEIFQGLATRPYPPGQQPESADSKIEMGVFVIKRGV